MLVEREKKGSQDPRWYIALIHDEVEQAVLLRWTGPPRLLPILTPHPFPAPLQVHPPSLYLVYPLFPLPQTYLLSLLLELDVLIINPNRRCPQLLSCRDRTPHPSSDCNRVGNERLKKLMLEATKHRPRTLKNNAQRLLLILEVCHHSFHLVL